jgi:hypothetical protein
MIQQLARFQISLFVKNFFYLFLSVRTECNEVKYSEDETEPKVNRLYKQIFVCIVNAC